MSTPSKNFKALLRYQEIDGEPVFWFFPIVLAMLAGLITVGGLIIGLLTFVHGYFGS